jgi:serine protease Do
MQQVAPELARSFGLERRRGALVAYVQPDSPGARAGIQEGDVILEFNGRTIMDMHELPRLVANTPPGSEAGVKLIRQGQEHQVQVDVGDIPEEPRQVSGDTIPGEELGLTVQELRPDMAQALGLRNMQAIVVTDVEEGSPADEEGLRPGDLILEVNRQQVINLHDFRMALSHTIDMKSVLFLLRRGENTLYVALQPEG